MTSSLTKSIILISILFPTFSALSQDDGGETAAEASVTGSAAQPKVGSSGAVEGNTMVLLVRGGFISLDQAMSLGLKDLRELVAQGGDLKALFSAMKNAGDVDLNLLKSLSSLELGEELLTAVLKVAAAYDSTNLQNQQALVAAASIAKEFLTDRTITSEANLPDPINVADFTKSGYNIALIEILNKYGAIGQKGNSLLDAEFGSSRSLSTALTADSSTAGYLDLLSTLTGGRSLTETVLGSSPADVDLSKPTASVIDVPMENVNLAPGANITIGATSSSGPDYSSGYAPETLANLIVLADEGTEIDTISFSASSMTDISNPNNPFANKRISGSTSTPEGTVSLTLDFDSGNSYYETFTDPTEGTSTSDELFYTYDELSTNKYKILLNSEGDYAEVDLASNTGRYYDYENQTLDEQGSFDFSFSITDTSSKSYQYSSDKDTATLTYQNTYGSETKTEVATLIFESPNSGSYKWTEYSDADLKVVVDSGSGTFNLDDSTLRELPVVAGPSTIDVAKYLTKNHDNSVYVIGAAKDLKIVSDVTFKNSNTEEDHALVIGAADDFMISGIESDRIDVTYEGSNLAFGSGGTESDSMYLVNTNITTGGNLAAATLGTLNITNATINVGNGGVNSDPDNIYLYANDLIQINNLDFSNSRLDDVYMEAITVNLKDVDFPAASQVHLRSKDGSLKFGTYSKPVVGAVNLTNVTHGAINGGKVLAETDFTKTSVGYKSSTSLATGHNAFTISSQSRGD